MNIMNLIEGETEINIKIQINYKILGNMKSDIKLVTFEGK